MAAWAASSSGTQWLLPRLQAACRGVAPSLSGGSTSARAASSSETQLLWFRLQAAWRAVTPSVAGRSTWAWAASSICTHSLLPPLQAACRCVRPSLHAFGWLTVARAPSSIRTHSTWRLFKATKSGVARRLLGWSTEAWAAINRSTQAARRGVLPSLVGRSTAALAASSSWTHSVWPLLLATCRAVVPYLAGLSTVELLS
eukprot:scaffold37235_cov63-Phaeocystis_antarctica.AAC.1